MRDAEELSLRDHLEQVMPEGGRARRLLGLGVVAWSAGGGAFERLSRSSNPMLRKVGSSIAGWIQAHAGSAPQALHTLASAGLRFAHAGLILLIGAFLGFLLLVSLPETAKGLVSMVPPG